MVWTGWGFEEVCIVGVPSYVMPTYRTETWFSSLELMGQWEQKSYCDELGQNCFTPPSSGVRIIQSVPAGAACDFWLSCLSNSLAVVLQIMVDLSGVGNSNTNGSQYP